MSIINLWTKLQTTYQSFTSNFMRACSLSLRLALTAQANAQIIFEWDKAEGDTLVFSSDSAQARLLISQSLPILEPIVDSLSIPQTTLVELLTKEYGIENAPIHIEYYDNRFFAASYGRTHSGLFIWRLGRKWSKIKYAIPICTHLDFLKSIKISNNGKERFAFYDTIEKNSPTPRMRLGSVHDIYLLSKEFTLIVGSESLAYNDEWVYRYNTEQGTIGKIIDGSMLYSSTPESGWRVHIYSIELLSDKHSLLIYGALQGDIQSVSIFDITTKQSRTMIEPQNQIIPLTKNKNVEAYQIWWKPNSITVLDKHTLDTMKYEVTHSDTLEDKSIWSIEAADGKNWIYSNKNIAIVVTNGVASQHNVLDKTNNLLILQDTSGTYWYYRSKDTYNLIPLWKVQSFVDQGAVEYLYNFFRNRFGLAKLVLEDGVFVCDREGKPVLSTINVWWDTSTYLIDKAIRTQLQKHSISQVKHFWKLATIQKIIHNLEMFDAGALDSTLVGLWRAVSGEDWNGASFTTPTIESTLNNDKPFLYFELQWDSTSHGFSKTNFSWIIDRLVAHSVVLEVRNIWGHGSLSKWVEVSKDVYLSKFEIYAKYNDLVVFDDATSILDLPHNPFQNSKSIFYSCSSAGDSESGNILQTRKESFGSTSSIIVWEKKEAWCYPLVDKDGKCIWVIATPGTLSYIQLK